MGTEDARAALAAAEARAGPEYVFDQLKSRIISCECLASAARMVARMPSMLYCGCGG